MLAPDVDQKIKGLVGSVETAEKSLERMKELGDDISRLRNDVESVINRSTVLADDLRPRLAAVRSQIERLGTPPKEGQEAPAVASERGRLNAEAAALDGAIKTLELTWVRARQTIDRITDLRLQIFTRSIMERMSSPLLPGMWRDALRDAPGVGRLLSYVASDWIRSAGREAGWLALGLAATLAGYVLLRRFATRFTGAWVENGRTLSYFEKAAAAAWIAPVRALPLAGAALAVYGLLDVLGLLYYPSASIAAATMRALIIYAAVSALVCVILAPDEPHRRLVALTDRSAIRMAKFLKAMTAVYAADLALTSISRTLYVPLSMSVVQSLIASVAFAALFIGLLLTPFEPAGHPSERPYPRISPRWLKVPLWVAALAILAAAGLGYVALARFIAQQLVMTTVVGVVVALLYYAIRAFTREPNGRSYPVGEVLEHRFGIEPPRLRQLARLTELALTILLLILALPVLLLQWGFSEADIRDWTKQLLFGFEVGQFRISLARILIGLLLFIGLLFLTRVIQRWLRDLLLNTERMDAGIVNSVDTAAGYAGIALAGLLAVSYAGFDVTNLAIVAGALSVGIGFGLQSIVNNFVSGLIVLIERPIKVGDWIVIGGEQGHVKRISVRSTEIETFDKASLIVPNSELIMGRVLNWTHRNSIGRILIKVLVKPSCDPRQVCEILGSVARRHPEVMQQPMPRATLDNLGSLGHEFTLRIYLSDIGRALEAQSEIRIEILEAFKANGVEVA